MYSLTKYSQILAQNFWSINTNCMLLRSNSSIEWNSYRLHAVGVENYLPIQSQFLYLYILTETFPFIARKYPSTKKIRFGESFYHTGKMIVYPSQVKLDYIFHKFVHNLMKNQLSPEYAAVKPEWNYTKIIIWNTPLNKNTYCLQTTATTFIGDIPMYLKFVTKEKLRCELGVWVFFYKFLRPTDIWSAWHLGVHEYSYTE